MEADRGQWSSKIGFILAGAGSAIGLGNIWRFPYIAGENGGAIFVLVYLLIVIFIGFPYMLAELALGRSKKSNPVGAIEAIKPKSPWKAVGYLGVLTGFGILAFYSVIAGWTVGYIYKMLIGQPGVFTEFIANPYWEIGLFALFLILTALIVQGGVSGGIEKWSKILMPLLFLVLLILIIYANTLPGSGKGLLFYLKPDFSEISGKTLLAALGQAFFSLSLGMGLMITYGSYVSKKENLAHSAFFISLFDTAIAFMSGLVIFPALFAMGKNPEAGPKLVFTVLPELFMRMPGGAIIGALFFVLLAIAALTSTISLLEVPVAYLLDRRPVSRIKMVWLVTAVTFLLALPSALSQGANNFLTDFGWLPARLSGADFLSHMSFLFGDLSLAVGGLLLSIFIGWIWGADKASEEIRMGSGAGFAKLFRVWIFLIRYFIPMVIFVILLNLFGIFGEN